jgi:flagellar biosynthesis chaperone FliJ
MSGETEREPSAWTIDSVRAHLTHLIDERDRRYEQRFSDQQRATEAALHSAERAVTKAEAAIERRLEAQNEFRGTLEDWAARLMPRAETEQRLSALAERLADLTTQVNLIQGRSRGLEGAWGYLVGAAAVLAVAISLFATR